MRDILYPPWCFSGVLCWLRWRPSCHHGPQSVLLPDGVGTISVGPFVDGRHGVQGAPSLM